MTVVVEDYYQHAGFTRVVQPDRWKRFETRVEANTRRALDLLREHDVRATFFVLGWIAEQMPQVVRAIVAEGHEVATKGHLHRPLDQMSRDEFRADACRSRLAIERAGGVRVHGYRVAQGTFTPADTWALDVLAEEGFAYDSSFYPRLASIAGQPWRRYIHRHRTGPREIVEVPLASVGVPWLSVPAAGGNYFRQMPDALTRRVIAAWHRRQTSPFTMYFHVWELDPDLPRIEAVGAFTRMRQYRNLDKMEGLLRELLQTYRFTSIADHLGLDPALPVTPEPEKIVVCERDPGGLAPCGHGARMPFTIVIPAFNEEQALPYLKNTLDEVLPAFAKCYDVRLIFVDDASTDATWVRLHELFGDRPDAKLVKLPQNRGVAGAILEGIRQAETEVVGSIDCDCTYDPRQLLAMIPLLTDRVAMVTASPYHPEGRVLNVPAWRLTLSKGLSFLYRRVLRNHLATYTACFRVYRRNAVKDLELKNGGYLGVVELLARLDLNGETVVECPAVLEVRLMGHSKMKLARTVWGHARLLVRVAVAEAGGPMP
jgi:polysaccharide deacetylase family protein (PEP-CTERM system associated)